MSYDSLIFPHRSLSAMRNQSIASLLSGSLDGLVIDASTLSQDFRILLTSVIDACRKKVDGNDAERCSSLVMFANTSTCIHCNTLHCNTLQYINL